MKLDLEQQSLIAQIMKKYVGYKSKKVITDFLIVFKLCIEVNGISHTYKNEQLSSTNGFRKALKDKLIINHKNYMLFLTDLMKYT